MTSAKFFPRTKDSNNKMTDVHLYPEFALIERMPQDASKRGYRGSRSQLDQSALVRSPQWSHYFHPAAHSSQSCEGYGWDFYVDLVTHLT